MSERSKFWYLKHFSLFDGMDDAAMESVDRMSTMNAVRPHQPIYFPDEPSRSVFFLKQGHVKIFRLHPDGREVILDVLGPGEIFGELALVDEEEPISESAEALDDVLICAVRRNDFEEMLKSHPELNVRIIKRVGLRLRRFEERVTDLVFKDTRRRIASFLVRYAEDLGRMKGSVVSIRMHLSHQEIALLTGAARQTITTTLNEFRSLGLIDFSRKGITIHKLEQLRRMAE